ncbi:MAG: LTA synthase family protein [Lachnospiraceae bacterium]|nr:LTA synthase family protein [Lachnospiraceae bacterium]
MDKKKLIKTAVSIIIFLALPAFWFILSQLMVQESIFEIDWKLILTNIVFFELLNIFLSAVAGNARIGLWIGTFLSWFIGALDNYIYRFRGSYIMPWDIWSFSTAMNVAGNYSYFPTRRVIVLTGAFLLLAVAAYFCDLDLFSVKKPQVPTGNESDVTKSQVKWGKICLRLLTAVLSAFLLFSFYPLTSNERFLDLVDFKKHQFTLDKATTKNGIVIGFISKIRYLNVEKPKGYNAAAQKEILDGITPEGEPPAELPDIIVIMSETFSDPKVVADFSTNADYMPFIHSLQENGENVVTGNLHVSVNGGNTPNTEFEYLTGNSLAFLPEGSIPYNAFIHRKMDALPWYLKSLGYQTLAMHPYEADNWKRPKVYPLLGFDDMHFLDYFEKFNPQYVRDYISDKSLSEQIIYELSHRADLKAPFFSFNVSMQNHSGYGEEYDNFHPDIELTDMEGDASDYEPLRNYLSLVKLSDEALSELCEHYSKEKRHTIIVFFGDHQPSFTVLKPIYKSRGIESKTDLTAEEDELRYIVPFMIWANYDIEEKKGIELSANYLGNLTLEAAGIPLTRYRSFTKEVSSRFPVVTAIHAVDSKGGDVPVAEVQEKLPDYSAMQYYEIFDDRDDYE